MAMMKQKSSHALALTRDGNVYGLGSNACLQLGFPVPTKDHRHYSSFTHMRMKGRAVKLAAGGLCSLLLLSTGQVFACGTEMRGELACGQGTRCLRRLTLVFKHLGPILDVESRHFSAATRPPGHWA
jgi:alpha-tubulin suppressor-like RCC1 family protein